LSPFLFFLYIQYAGFCRQQNAAGKQICGASRPANTPRQACSLDCIAKLRFAFQPAPAGKTVTPGFRASRQTPFRLDSLQSTTLSGNYYFHPGASRPTAFAAYLFIPAHTTSR